MKKTRQVQVVVFALMRHEVNKLRFGNKITPQLHLSTDSIFKLKNEDTLILP